MIDDLVALRHEQELDEARAVEWVGQTSLPDMVAVWMDIQRMSDKSCRNGELIARFAQLGMSHAVLLANSRKAVTS